MAAGARSSAEGSGDGMLDSDLDEEVAVELTTSTVLGGLERVGDIEYRRR